MDFIGAFLGKEQTAKILSEAQNFTHIPEVKKLLERMNRPADAHNSPHYTALHILDVLPPEIQKKYKVAYW